MNSVLFTYTFVQDKYLYEVLKKTIDNGLDVSYLISHQLPEEGSNIAKIPLLDATLLYRRENLSLAFNGLTPACISAQDLQYFHRCESFALASIDRILPVPQSIRSNQAYYHDLLRYFLAFLTENKTINVILFDTIPHMPWDIVLYFVAKKLGLTTYFIRRTGIGKYIHIDSDFINGDQWYRDDPYPLEITNNKLNNKHEVINYLKNNLTAYKNSLPKTNLISVSSGKEKKMFSDLRKFYYVLRNRPVPLNHEGANHNTRQNTVLAGIKQMNQFNYARLYTNAISALNKNKNYLLNNAVQNPDLTKNYIYFALHFQPERSTLPEGLEFKDQLLALDILSKALPEGWKLYVKEHPRQLVFDLRKIHFRDISDYEAIKKLENTELISTDYDSNTLIEKCRMTATISGTTGWEGLLEGKPSLIFSPNWTMACKSAAYVTSLSSAKQAIQGLLKKSSLEVESDVADFYNTIADRLIFAAHNENSAALFDSRLKSIDTLAKAIIYKINKTTY